MDVPGVIDAFQRLRTSDSRHGALTALLAELTPYEWRQLHAILAARSFHFDIVAQLPIELVTCIFSYLDPSAPYRLQSVSTQWSRLLRSLDLLKSSLSSWYDGCRDFRNFDYSSCRAEAQSLHAFRTGNPKSRFKLSLEQPMAASILIGETLIWQPRIDVCRMVFLLHLKTWSLRTVSAEARLAISSFCASDQIIVLSTLDVFYAFTIHDLKQKKFRTPSHAFREAMSCRGRSVACAANFAQHMEVYIWNYDTQAGKSFQVRQDPSHNFFALGPRYRHRVALLLHPDNGTIMIFGEIHCSQEAPRRFSFSKIIGPLLYSRFTFAGKCVSHSCLEPTLGLERFSLLGAPDDFVSVNHNGLFAFHVKALYRAYERDILLRFDENLDMFTTFSDPQGEERSWVDVSIAWWKDTFYGTRSIIKDSSSQDFWGLLGNSRPPKFKPLVPQPKDIRKYVRGSQKSTIMNEKFVIHNSGHSIHVLAFEPNDEQPQNMGPIHGIEIINDFGTTVVDGALRSFTSLE